MCYYNTKVAGEEKSCHGKKSSALSQEFEASNTLKFNFLFMDTVIIYLTASITINITIAVCRMALHSLGYASSNENPVSFNSQVRVEGRGHAEGKEWEGLELSWDEELLPLTSKDHVQSEMKCLSLEKNSQKLSHPASG